MAEAKVTAPAGVGQIFSRNSTGLVKLGTPYRALVLNFANIGLTYIMFTYWLQPGVFPQSNLVLSILIAAAGSAVFSYLYALFSTAMPRSGSEYVYLSRTLHPSIGFACSFAAATSQSFWTGIGGYWIATLVLNPMLTAFGGITGSRTLIELGNWFGSPLAGWILGTLSVLTFGYIVALGLGTYFKFQNVNWVIGLVTFVVLLIILAVNTHQSFVSGINHYALVTSHVHNAYQTILAEAHKAGMPSGITLHDTLGIFAIIWLVAWASTYIGAEVQTPRKTQLWGTVGGSLTYTAAVVLLALLIGKTVGFDFNAAASYLNLQTTHYPLSVEPVFILWVGVLIHNPILLALVGLGLVIWSYFWIPGAMIIATRAMFAWSLDRLLPDKLSEVNERFHSPIYSVVLVAILAEIFLTLYALGIFQFLSPFLAYAVVFTFVSIAGILFPFLPKTADLYRNSGVNGRLLGIPWFTLAGVVGLAYWLIALYYALTTPLLGLNGRPTLILTALEFLVPFVLYFVIRAARKSRGLMIDKAFQVIPPE